MAETHDRMIGRFAAVLAELHAIEPTATRLCEAGRRMLHADGAALALATSSGAMLVMAATDDLARQLEDVQDVVGQGPRHDAYAQGVVQVVDFASSVEEQWSILSQHSGRLEFAGTLITVPLRPDDHVIGTLSIHRQAAENPDDMPTAQFLSVAIGTGMLQDPVLGRRGDVLSDEWPSMAQIHQATGMIISQTGLRPEDAMALLRGQAFANGISVLDVAQQVAERRIDFRHFTIEGD